MTASSASDAASASETSSIGSVPPGTAEMAEVTAGGCALPGRPKGALDAPGARDGEQGGRAAPGGLTDLDEQRPRAGEHRGLDRDGGGQAEARPTDGASWPGSRESATTPGRGTRPCL